MAFATADPESKNLGSSHNDDDEIREHEAGAGAEGGAGRNVIISIPTKSPSNTSTSTASPGPTAVTKMTPVLKQAASTTAAITPALINKTTISDNSFTSKSKTSSTATGASNKDSSKTRRGKSTPSPTTRRRNSWVADSRRHASSDSSPKYPGEPSLAGMDAWRATLPRLGTSLSSRLPLVPRDPQIPPPTLYHAGLRGGASFTGSVGLQKTFAPRLE
eukprot:UC4_evm1s1479